VQCAVKYGQLEFLFTLLHGSSYLLTQLLLINTVVHLFCIEFDRFSVFFYTSLHFCLCGGLNICVWKYSSCICISISQKMLLVLIYFHECFISYGPSLQDQWADRLRSTAWGPGMSGPDMSSGLWLWVRAGVIHPLSLMWVSQPMWWCHLSQRSDMPDGGGELWGWVLPPCACMWVCIKFIHLMTLWIVFFLSFNLLIGWQLSIWDCCKPFFSLLDCITLKLRASVCGLFVALRDSEIPR